MDYRSAARRQTGALARPNMCLMLYVGCKEPLRETSDPDLRIESVEPGRRAVEQWFSFPSVQFVARTLSAVAASRTSLLKRRSSTGRGCGSDSDEREADIQSMRALIELLRNVIKPGESVELYPVWDGNEVDPPKGRVVWPLERIAPDTSVFTEQFLYEVRSV